MAGTADERLRAALADGTIGLLSCAWLRERAEGFIIPRHQDMPPEALLTPQEAEAAFSTGDRSIGALSYGWLTRPHPDPRGDHAAYVIPFLRTDSGLRFKALFWDFGCIPEPDEDGFMTEADHVRQQRAFALMNAMCKSRPRLEPWPPARTSSSS